MRGSRMGSRMRSGGGFTILEIVLAMAILFLGMTAVLGFLSVGAALSRTAQVRGDAAQAVEAVVADLEENAFPMLSEGEALGRAPIRVGEPRSFVERPVPGYPGLRYSATLTPEPDPPPDRALEYRVEVEIAWRAAGERRSRRFTTLITAEIPFGERMRRTFLMPEDSGGAEPRGADRR